jgi:hypothetical protein
MLLRLLFRKELLLLTGVTAAFVIPMFRSGELTVGKIGRWLSDGIDPPTASTDSGLTPQEFALWTPGNGRSPLQVDLIPQDQPNPSTSVASTLSRFLGSLFEVQTVDEARQLVAIPEPHASANWPTGTGGLPSAPAPVRFSGLSPSHADLNQPDIADRADPFGPLATRLTITDLREVIRFDISPHWVQQRWQPATQLAPDPEGYHGIRVALVTDHQVGNLQGAFTYFFDDQAKVQRIQFQGTASQLDPIRSLLEDYFNFKPVPDRPRLWAPVHRQTARGMFRHSDLAPRRQFDPTPIAEVAFEINSTQGRYQLSETYRQLAIQ